jgi:hypothetical protein
LPTEGYSRSEHRIGRFVVSARLLHYLEERILLWPGQSPQEGQGMLDLLAKFWRDDRGFVPATEWMLVTSILTLGTIAAMWSIHTIDDRSDDSPVALIYSGLSQE